MNRDRRHRLLAVAAAVLSWASANEAAAAPPTPTPMIIAKLDLSKAFHLASGWTLIATQGPPVEDPQVIEETAPGEIHLCLSGPKSPHCAPDLVSGLRRGEPDMYSEIHFLDDAAIVHPRGTAHAPLLMVRTASFHAGNGDQVQSIQLVTYLASKRRFGIVFHEQSARNNNQEIRYIPSGPLKGAMISVHPTQDAPFAYWVNVYRASAGDNYRRALRYRSATRYGDGNQLSVIDSEMPNIVRQLKLWHPGQLLPLPATSCPRPHLIRTALWCS